MKRLLLILAKVVSLPFGLLPPELRRAFVFVLLTCDSRIGKPKNSLKQLYRYADDLERLINERAMAYGEGVHPKHRLTRYHQFFVARIPSGAKVLDIGCGYGEVARSIARQCDGVEVTGIDIEKSLIRQAQAADNPRNLEFIEGDALTDLPEGRFNVIVLSNILEHLEERIAFLKELGARFQPERVLVRVPLFERSWHVPMRKELGMGYFSDRTHFIEHRLDEFDMEVRAAGLKVAEQVTLWGEIWAVCVDMDA